MAGCMRGCLRSSSALAKPAATVAETTGTRSYTHTLERVRQPLTWAILYAESHTYCGVVARGGSTVAIPSGRGNLDMEPTPELEQVTLEQVTEELPEYALLVDLPDE